MGKIKVGLIGFGLSGRVFHAPLITAHNGFELAMVCSSRTDEIKTQLPGVMVTADPYELINNKNLDLIVNCAPNLFHYLYSAAALENDKHVLVEKPFVNTVEEGEQLISLAQRKQKTLSVFHNRRWDADFLTVKRLIANSTLGEIKQFESHFDRWRPAFREDRWREQALGGSGTFYDLGSHLIDQALVLFGVPEKLMADICQQKDEGLTDDYFHVVFYYGKTRVILHSSSFTGATPRFQVFGSKRTFIKHGLDPQETQLKSGISPLSSLFGEDEDRYFGRLINPESGTTENVVSEKGNYLSFYDDLYKSIITGADPPVPASDALRVIRMVELARQSSESSKSIAVSNMSSM